MHAAYGFDAAEHALYEEHDAARCPDEGAAQLGGLVGWGHEDGGCARDGGHEGGEPQQAEQGGQKQLEDACDKREHHADLQERSFHREQAFLFEPERCRVAARGAPGEVGGDIVAGKDLGGVDVVHEHVHDGCHGVERTQPLA